MRRKSNYAYERRLLLNFLNPYPLSLFYLKHLGNINLFLLNQITMKKITKILIVVGNITGEKDEVWGVKAKVF